MKIIHDTQFTEGVEVPSTEHVTTDIATLDTDDLWYRAPLDKGASLPHRLVLRTRPVPLPVHDLSATVSLICDGMSLAAQALYDPQTLSHHFPHDLTHCQFSSLELHYEDSPWAELLPFTPGDMIYTKPFSVQVGRLVHEERERRHTLIRQLYGYGGIYSDGLPLEEIQQVYFELFEGFQRTEISLTTETQWRNRGIVPFPHATFKGQQILTDAEMTYEQSLSLGTALTEGHAQFQVMSPEMPDPVTYISSEAEHPLHSPTFIDVTFERQGESI